VLRELTRQAMSLEDVFVRLTRHEPAAGEADAAARVAAEEPDAAPAPAEEPPQ
jgi:hypothetical protein